MLLDLINFEKLRRAAIYFLLLLAVLLFQNGLFSRVSLLGVRPMFVPVLVIGIAMFEGGVWGGAFGLVTGVFCDMSMGTSVLFTVLLPILGYFAGLLAEYFINRRFFAFFFLCLAALAITALCQMFRPLFILGASPLVLLYTGLLQVLWSLPFTLPLYFPCRAVSRRSQERNIHG